MDSYQFRPLTAEDIPQATAIINRSGFGAPITPSHWRDMEGHDHITYLALHADQVIGAIPFALRDFCITPRTSVRSAFAHMVSIDPEHRNRGLGSQLMDWSLNNLKGICDLVCVYTGCEGHSPYRFYQHNGFFDLSYAYRYDHPAVNHPIPEDFQFHPIDQIQLLESALSKCFQQCYSDDAGFPKRGPGFWMKASKSIIFHQGPRLLGILARHNQGQILGYALLAKERDLFKILELACHKNDSDTATRLLAGSNSIAGQENLSRTVIYCSSNWPFLELLRKLGWECGSREVNLDPEYPDDPDPWERHRIIAGRILNFGRLFGKHWAEGEEALDISLRVWTGATKSLLLHPSHPGARMVNLEMKEETLHRFLLHRINLRQAIKAEWITVQTGKPEDIEQIHSLFLPSPWQYFEMDYI